MSSATISVQSTSVSVSDVDIDAIVAAACAATGIIEEDTAGKTVTAGGDKPTTGKSAAKATAEAKVAQEAKVPLSPEPSDPALEPWPYASGETDRLEPLLRESRGRFVMFPIRYASAWKMYKKHVATFWTAEELRLASDLTDWRDKLNDDERHYIKYVLAFFAASDGIVSENLALRFLTEVKAPEVRAFYAFQNAMETIHSEVYSLLIDTYVRDDPQEQDRLFNAIDTLPGVAEKAEWALKWINNSSCFAERLVAFAAVEGIFFSGSFCSIFWLKKRHLMPGLCKSNEWISRDEGLHTTFACMLYRMLERKLPKSRIYEIITEAVKIEQRFVTESLRVALIGMNANLMTQYIQTVADNLLEALGLDKLYKNPNPFEWMEMLSLTGKSNFFETEVTEYAKVDVVETMQENGGPNKAKGVKFTFSADDEGF